MSDLNVNLEDMIASAIATTGHGENLATCRSTADDRLTSAAAGWAGRSATALANRASVWSARSSALVTRIGDHAAHLHTGAWRYAGNENDRSRVSSELAM